MNRDPEIGKSAHKSFFLLAIATIIILVAFWLRTNNLDQFPPGITVDEGMNVLEAFQISQVWRFPFYEDPGRPEPIFRTIGTLSSFIFGQSIWAQRFTTALVGTLTVAVLFWAMRQCVPDLSRHHRWITGLAVAGSLAVSIGHITMTRSTYRAAIQPLFMALFAGFLLRGLRNEKRRDFVLAALALAAVIYTYFAGLVVPFSIAFVVISLLLFQRSGWRRWLSNLILMTAIFALLVSPLLYLLSTDSERILWKVEKQADDPRDNTLEKLSGTWRQFMVIGDVTPMYNTESAPLVPRTFDLLFMVGLLALIIRGRRISSALVLGFLLLTPIPMVGSDEIPQNIRSIGLYATYPLVIGLGTALILMILASKRWSAALITGLLIVLIGADSVYAYRTYNEYWEKSYLWTIFGRDIPHGEWFFRTDRRDFSLWLAQQEVPLLVPVTELNRTTTRAWLMQYYPHVKTSSDENIAIPPDTRLVVPWSLGRGGLMRNERHFALLQDDVITLLPPLTAETYQVLVSDIDDATAIYRDEGTLSLLAHVKPVPDDMMLTFERMTHTTPFIYDDGVRFAGWSGPETVASGKNAEYVLYLEALKPLWHRYDFYVELHTQDYDRKIWDHDGDLIWLYPSLLWEPGETVTQLFRLPIPSDLPPGAYRLVVGTKLSFFAAKVRPVTLDDGTPYGNPVTVAWIKVPQPERPMNPDGAENFDATLANSIALRSAYVSILENGQVQLTLLWEALVNRPDFDATIFVHILDSDGELVAQQDQRPWGGQYPTQIWDEKELVQTNYVFDIQEQTLDSLSVLVGMYTYPDITRLPVMQDGKPVDDSVIRLGQLGSLLID